MRRFSVGAVLGITWQVWRRNALAFTVIALLIYAPTVVARLAMPASDVALPMIGIAILLNTLIAAALTYGVVLELDGSRPSFRDCVVRGLAQLPRAIGATLLSFLLALGGFLLLVVPGIIATMMFYVVMPVAVIERLPAGVALRRSRELTHGHKLEMFVVVLITGLATGAVTFAVNDGMAGTGFVYVSTLLDAVFASFTSVLAAVAYTLLRHEKNGTSLPEIASAFARYTPRISPPTSD